MEKSPSHRQIKSRPHGKLVPSLGCATGKPYHGAARIRHSSVCRGSDDSGRVVGNPYLIALCQSRGDRAALAYTFVTVALKPVGTIEQMKMAAVSRLTDFSFDWYPLFTPVAKKSHPRCTTRVTTAGSSKS